MLPIYLICAPEEADTAAEFETFLRQQGFFVRVESSKFGYPPARPGEVTLLLWSKAARMSGRQLLLTNRAIDAWADESLEIINLDKAFLPQGLADLEAMNFSFEPARTAKLHELARRLRDRKSRPALAPDAPPSGPGMSAPTQSPAPVGAPTAKQVPRRGGLFGWFRGLVSKNPPGGDAIEPFEEVTFREWREPGTNPPSHTFFSYAHADKDKVWPLVDGIESAGEAVWIDREIHGGEGWAGAIVRAIKASSHFCIVCTEHAFASNHVRREIYLADKYEKDLIPVLMDASMPEHVPEDIEYFLIDRQRVTLDPRNVPGAVNTLLEVLA